MRKIVFLDIDGVLNSEKYDRQRTAQDGNIDETRLAFMKELIDYTNADIVLSSSWRKHWSRNAEECDAIGMEINHTFERYGLKIFDKTPIIGARERAAEIQVWLDAHVGEVESFVILDDTFGGWGALQKNLVKTNSRIGRGFERSQMERAKELLCAGQ